MQSQIHGDILPAAELAEFGLPVVPAAVASYVTAKYSLDGRRVILTLAALPVTMVKATTVSAGGGVDILDFPKCYLKPAGSTSALSVSGVAATYVLGLGSAAAGTDGALTSTEVTFGPSTSTVIPGGGTVAIAANADSGNAIDGTSSAVSVYLNAAIAADGTGKEALTVSGTIVLAFANLSIY